ncbi:hypothetical protein Tco_1578395, partial [Tanacetum coccineum]
PTLAAAVAAETQPKMSSADVARSHKGDGGGDDHPPSHVVLADCGGCIANKDKIFWITAKEIAEAKSPVSISFEKCDKQTLNHLGPHAAYWSNYIREIVRNVPLYYLSWEKVLKEQKAAIISEIVRRERLEATGEYTEDEINALARGGKLRGHIPGVGRVLPSRATSRAKEMFSPLTVVKSMIESGYYSGGSFYGDDEESGDDEDDDGER